MSRNAPVFRVGVDIGGTSVKCGVLDEGNNFVARGSIRTNPEHPFEDVVERIGGLIKETLTGAGVSASGGQCAGVGMGSPGIVDSRSGVVVFAGNLNWSLVPLAGELAKHIDLPIKAANDADCAALGESLAGAAAGCRNVILVTLGTGVGGGVVLDGKIFSGGLPGGGELGHMLLVREGLACTCGRKGCYEAYANAGALERAAVSALSAYPDSLMGHRAAAEFDCEWIFDCAREGDFAAKGVIYNYINCVGDGLVDLTNIFRPEKIIIGGGVGQAGASLTDPLNEYVMNNCFAGKRSFYPQVVPAVLGNDAGIIGAANLGH